jgi:aldehyde dehydrogenase (NAD(P)+)
MLDGIEKAVLRAPLTTFPKPAYFPSHRTTHKMMPNLVAMEENARWGKVPGIVFNATRG